MGMDNATTLVPVKANKVRFTTAAGTRCTGPSSGWALVTPDHTAFAVDKTCKRGLAPLTFSSRRVAQFEADTSGPFVSGAALRACEVTP